MNRRKRLCHAASDAVRQEIHALGYSIRQVAGFAELPFTTLHRFINFDRDPHLRGPRRVVIERLLGLPFWSDGVRRHLQAVVDFDCGLYVSG